MTQKNKYSVGSMFAGVGGICLAFQNANCQLLWANEIDSKACETYRANFKNHLLIEEDVNKITNPKDLGKTDIITSGFPCQAFSVAGYQKGFKDPRGNLFFETARFINDLQPQAYLLENVRNLVGHDNGRTFKIIEETIREKLNYSFIPFILNSMEYGNIPQTRERVYIVGFKDEGDFNYDNIENSEDLYSEYCSNQFKIPEKKELTRSFRDLTIQDKVESKYYYPEGHQYYETFKEEITRKDTVYQWRRVYVRENKSNVCPTLTANMGTGGHNVPIILDDYGFRKLTPRECFNMQGFPPTFKLPETVSNTALYKQAGNSVVVPVVQRIAKEMVRVLDWKQSLKIAKNKAS